jgi:hypothetical protein
MSAWSFSHSVLVVKQHFAPSAERRNRITTKMMMKTKHQNEVKHLKRHTAFSYEQAKKIIDALEVLERDYELRRELQPTEYAQSEKWGRIPKPKRIEYTITEF